MACMVRGCPGVFGHEYYDAPLNLECHGGLPACCLADAV